MFRRLTDNPEQASHSGAVIRVPSSLRNLSSQRHWRRLPLLLLLLAPMGADLKAADVPLQRSIAAEQKQQHQRFTGVWALTDNGNNLFNGRLSADGGAVSTSGVDGVPQGGSSQLCANQLCEEGRRG